jgi:hypothetical protein
MQKSGNNVNIKNTIGDIDIFFVDEEFKLLYICECKHNRLRFDYNNWKRDYEKFENNYTKQLERKVTWANENKKVIEEHLQIKDPKLSELSISDYTIRGIFIINAPTVYMFNGEYKSFTISDINHLLNREYVIPTFSFKKEGRDDILIEYPYFDNVDLKFDEFN